MCGIAGFFDKNNKLGQDQLRIYNKELHKRGPDGSDIYFNKTETGSLGFAHVRLSILDLSDLGKQPMIFQNLVIVLNGEIYNFRNIQIELRELGYSFNSESDTEVVLKAFHAWGPDCVKKFRGMFALAIYDNLKNQLYFCRDRVGVKPLYYSIVDDRIIFGSELKVFFNTLDFIVSIDYNSLRTFINYGYITHPNTIVNNIYKVEVGCWTIINLDTFKLELKRYWQYAQLYENNKFEGSFKEAISQTELLVREACELRMVSDVPVGVFLSGGFDSTLVTSVLQKDRTEKLKTFTIGFSDGVDESKDAERIARHLGTDHTTYDCTQKEAMELIPFLPELYDDLIGDISCIPTMLVSSLAKKEVSVALSADGGDELFAGYDGFKKIPEVLNLLEKIPLKTGIAKLLNLSSNLFYGRYNHIHKKLQVIFHVLLAPETDKLYQYHIHQSGIPFEILDRLFLQKSDLKYPVHSHLKLKENLDELFILGVDDVLRDLLLVKMDRATMGFSLEGREPLLDHILMEFAASLPYHFKNDGITSKRPIREIVYKYVPKEIMDRPKIGFDLPIYKWLQGDLKYLLDEYLGNDDLDKQQIFNSDYVQFLIKQFKNNQLRYTPVIWRLLIFQMWFRKWINNR